MIPPETLTEALHRFDGSPVKKVKSGGESGDTWILSTTAAMGGTNRYRGWSLRDETNFVAGFLIGGGYRAEDWPILGEGHNRQTRRFGSDGAQTACKGMYV